jgi:hypothetical protein
MSKALLSGETPPGAADVEKMFCCVRPGEAHSYGAEWPPIKGLKCHVAEIKELTRNSANAARTECFSLNFNNLRCVTES